MSKQAGLWAIVGLGLLLAAPLGAEEKYEIKIDREDKVGQKFHTIHRIVEDIESETIMNGRHAIGSPEENRGVAVVEGIEEILEVVDGKTRKIRITVKKLASISPEGKEEAILNPGAVIEIEIGEEDINYKVDSEPADAATVEILSDIYSASDTEMDEDAVYGLKGEKRAVGDVWKVNAKLLAAELAEMGVVVSEDNIESTMKLKSVAEVGGVECFEVEGIIKLHDFRPPYPEGMKSLKGEAEMRVSGIFPIDNTSSPFREKESMIFETEAAGKINGVHLEQSSIRKNARITSRLPYK